MGTIIGIGSDTGSGSTTITGGVCAGLGVGLGVGMTDAVRVISHSRVLAMYSIALVLVSP